MITQNVQSRKRDRVDEEDFGTSGFSAHRNKRIASLPRRISPNAKGENASAFTLNYFKPARPTITPTDSDSEEVTWAAIPPVTIRTDNDDEAYQSRGGSPQPAEIFEGPTYSDDFEMTDISMHLSPGPFQPDPPSTNLASRIPTPIHGSFAYLPPTKPFAPLKELDDTYGQADRFRRGRRLPSPISEGEMSPSIIVNGMNDMQMEVESSAPPTEMEKSPPKKKGHTRSKHSLRNWNGYTGDLVGNANCMGPKRSFSMGYRADCEKCRNKVPGHFSHIITY